jgi:hypothetical protein
VVEQFYGGKAAGGFGASGNNPSPPKHDAMVQAIHDAACHLGAQCLNEIDADSGADEGANKGADMWDQMTEQERESCLRAKMARHIESSTSKEAGLPQESTDTPTATADEAAAADQSADDAVKAKAARSRALAYLIKRNTSHEE